MNTIIQNILIRGATADRVGINLMRIAIAIVFIWIGGLKFAPYEADSITPFVAHSPFLSFFYKHPGQYSTYLTREGELKPAERAWQVENGTYRFSDGLGSVEIMIGLNVRADSPAIVPAGRRCMTVKVPYPLSDRSWYRPS